jgi:hypothetical protein
MDPAQVLTERPECSPRADVELREGFGNTFICDTSSFEIGFGEHPPESGVVGIVAWTV